MEKLILMERRLGYGAEQVEDWTLTVGDLKQMLEQYDDEALVILKLQGRGATYVGIGDYPYEEDEE